MACPSDLSDLEILDENSMVEALTRRYDNKQFYTNIGEILVAINPCEPLPIFDDEHHRQYGLEAARASLPPHLFALAREAHLGLGESGRAQCLLVSGESGAGKTEATKFLLSHLIFLSHSQDSLLLQKIVQASPLLEAFGNAGTVRNYNSSRFGKLVELQYDVNLDVTGARLVDFLLEKTRVVHRLPGEKNFHVFYALFAGMARERLLYYFLEEPENHRILVEGCRSHRVFSDEEEFQNYAATFDNLTSLMHKVGFTEEHLTLIWMTLAAVLHLADVNFVAGEEGEGVRLVDQYPLHVASRLLGVEQAHLAQALTSALHYIKGETIQAWRGAREAGDGRDALVKEIYARMFGWVVGQLNRLLSSHPLKAQSTRDDGGSISVLDLSGFEDFPCNGLEQLLINVSNERLQQHFLSWLFPREAEECRRQGLQLELPPHTPNTDVIDLIFQRPGGVLALLEEESRFPQASDVTLVEKLSKVCGTNPRYVPPRPGKTSFAIRHYAHKVRYDARGFLERNRDSLSPDLLTCMQNSSNDFIRELFNASVSATGSISTFASKYDSRPALPAAWRNDMSDLKQLKAKLSNEASVSSKERLAFMDSTRSAGRPTPTLTRHFRRSLSELMERLTRAEPHFVRCLKPNAMLAPCLLDRKLLHQQLLCTGLVEVARLRQLGFPVRMEYRHFVARYGSLLDTGHCHTEGLTDADLCSLILSRLQLEDFRLGRTKVFLKMWQKGELEEALRMKVLERKLRLSHESLVDAVSLADSDVSHPSPSQPRASPSGRSMDSGHVSDGPHDGGHLGNKRLSVPVLSLPNPPPDLSRRRNTFNNLLDNLESPPADYGNSTYDQKPSGLSWVDKMGEMARSAESLSIRNDLSTAPLSRAATPSSLAGSRAEGLDGVSIASSDRRTQDDNRSTATTTNLDKDEQEEEDDSWRPYDIFQVSEREFDDDDAIFKEIMKFIRVVLYIFFFCVVFFCTVVGRLSLFLIASEVKDDNNEKGSAVVLLIFCLVSPMAWNWLNAFMKILFGGKEWPSFKTFIVILFMELLQTTGVALLVFRVLPSTDFFRGIVVTLASFQVPALLRMLMHDRKWRVGAGNCVHLVMALLGFLCQGGALAFFLLTNFTEAHDLDWNVTLKSLTDGRYPALAWELPTALVLISAGWWENFVSGDWTVCGKAFLPFKRWRAVLQDVRETSYCVAAPFKAGLLVLLAKYLTRSSFALSPGPGPKDDPLHHHLVTYGLVYIQIGAGVLCTYLAGLACKLHMQRTAFALPLLLSPPASLALVYAQCRYSFMPDSWHRGDWLCPNTDLPFLVVPLIAGGVLWVSYCLVAGHSWFPSAERMAKIERMFITPHFDTMFPDFNLTMRRRRYDQEVRSARFSSFRYVGEEGDVAHDEGDNHVTPMVYVCATMWHETRTEMTQLLKSLFRLDYVHCASRLAQEKFRIRDPDYFDLEVHVIFDDAFELDAGGNHFVPNSFVLQLIDCMEDAARSVVKGPITIPPPTKVPTPYGGRLEWTMPGQTKMMVHLKDKNKIRHRKRWSQCMYMYYLLGYKLLGGKDEELTAVNDSEVRENQKNVRNRKKGKHKRGGRNSVVPLRTLLMRMPPEKYERVIQTAESTYILTLDGDVDFKPDSVKLLIDRMKKNRKVGAVCGRIHPIGSGPMVWYQQFEYAVGHWLQKAAEHVFGCVLCCPGCFSLFRGSALMDDNVLKMYTTKPTEASHYIQFEQGEDRWLCTLLLQQGHRIDYCAGADALTFAPETFNEFFNQRRRWSPSTLANMMDLLSSWRTTVRINDNISRPYILYQFILMASTILAPSTVVLMITGSYHSVLGLEVWWAYVLSIAPVVLYLIVCMTQKSSVQITVAAVLTALYTVVMMVATVGTIISIATENFNSPNVVFLCGLGAIFIIAGLLHPQEFFCLVYGALYFMVVPATFILLTVYYLCNLNNVSWGTREVPRRLTPEEEEEHRKAEEEKMKKKSRNFFSIVGLMALVQELRDAVRGLMGYKQQLTAEPSTSSPEAPPPEPPRPAPPPPLPAQPEEPRLPTGYEPDPDNPWWFGIEQLSSSGVAHIEEDEAEFWQYTIKKYLLPLDEDASHKKKIQQDLIHLKNNVVFIFFMLNFLWTIITLQLQTNEDKLKSFYVINKYEPLSLVFLSIFAIALGLQFFSMFFHRWGTFLHLVSSTRIDWFKKTHTEEDFARFVVHETQRLQVFEPTPDYEGDADYDEAFETSTTSEAAENPERGHAKEQATFDPASMHQWRRNTLRRLRNPSNTSDTPVLQSIFEQNLEILRSKWQHGGHVERTRHNARHDSRRWSPQEATMRNRLYTQNFQRPQHHVLDMRASMY